MATSDWGVWPQAKVHQGENNIVADALSRMAMTEADFSPEAFAADEHDFPEAYPLSFKEIAFEQSQDKEVQELLEKQPDKYKKLEFKHCLRRHLRGSHSRQQNLLA
jgi:hypothetical protein